MNVGVARSERFELPTLGFEVRCSIQLSYERVSAFNGLGECLKVLGTNGALKKTAENIFPVCRLSLRLALRPVCSLPRLRCSR
jgi:hypothetical protein